VAGFFALLLRSGRAYSLVPARANGQPAFGAYVRAPDGTRHATGVFVLTLAGDKISALARFRKQRPALVRAAPLAAPPIAARGGNSVAAAGAGPAHYRA
jgi:hypothetical protein